MVAAFRILVLIVSLGPLIYYLLSLFCVVDYFRAVHKIHPTASFPMPPVSILKPVRGADREAYENFASFCRLNYPEYEVIFAASDPDDPVIPVIEKLQRDFPGLSIRLVTCVANRGANNKVNNLCQLVREAKYELVAISDSDVRVQPGYLQDVVRPLADPKVGVVTTFYRGLSPKGWVAGLDALGMYTESAPGALVARKLEGKMQFAFGWTMATTKAVLSGIGGFESLVNHHSDDFELGNRISRLGYRIELMRTPVWMVFPQETIAEYFRHELRWSIGLRNVRPTGYLGMLLTHGFAWTIFASAAALSAGWKGLAAAYVLSYLILRLGVVWTAAWGFGDNAIAVKLYLVPLRDALSFVTWLAGLFQDRIVWRGVAYDVRKGLLIPVHGSKLAH